jgi:ABC-type transporter Mla maintaining outer membrane lipid asymmetry ATPase subunit MlaF
MKKKLGLARAMIHDPDVLFHKSNCRFEIPN